MTTTSAPDRDAINAEVEAIRALTIEPLRARWFATFRKAPPKALTKELMARMICYRIQEEAFGGLDRETIKLLDRLARGDKTELNRRLKSGTVVVRMLAKELSDDKARHDPQTQ